MTTWIVRVNGAQVARYAVQGKAEIKARLLRRAGATGVTIEREG